ncbi:MAG TPA: FAD:protein FMN transferase [Candidatus Nanopelagicales bacterium]|nr:FAD:protein FMN transferase [Candidatus Nanopelagicales bacterium]
MPVLTRTFDLWGGEATVAVDGDERELDAAVTAVRRWLDEVDVAASHYRDDSELAGLHRADGRATRVGPVLAEALEVALDAARRTDGLVDPTVGAVTLSAPASLPLVTRAGSWRDVELADVDATGATVTLPVGVRLDLGATAKAWAADRAAGLAFLATGTGVLVSLAGDLAVAGPAPEGGWLVLVTDDHRETEQTKGDRAETVSITAGGLATSSTTVRRRTTADGRTVSHVVDPVNWRPVTPVWRTVSVAAPDCVTANTATTAAIVLGERAESWLAEQGLPTRLVSTDGRLVRLGAWPEPQIEGAGA